MKPDGCAQAPVVREHSQSTGVSARLRRAISGHWSEAVIVALALLLWAPRLSGPIDLRWDASVYYLLGTSLANGHGYRIPSEPGSPQALQYPPLLPTVIAMHQWALGTNDAAVVASRLRITYALVFVGYALAALRLAKRHLHPVFALTAATLCLLNPFTIFLSDVLFAEVPFAAISLLFALVATGGPSRLRPRLREAGSFALATAGFLLRTAGIALFVAWVVDAMIRRRWRLALARAVLALCPILAWQTYVAHVHASDEYAHPAYNYQRASYQYYNVSYIENILLVDPFRPELGRLNASAMAARLTTNLTSVLGAIGEVISAKERDWRGTVKWAQGSLFGRTPIPTGVVRVPIFGFGALVVGGLLVFVRRREWLLICIVLASIALVCTTPWPDQFTRYLEPIAPFLTIAAVLALCEMAAAVRARGNRSAFAFARLASATLLLFTLLVEVHTVLWLFGQRTGSGVTFVRGVFGTGFRWFLYDRSWQNWENAVIWIDTHGPLNAIVATTAPHFCYLSIGRLAVLPPMEVEPARERRLLDTVPASYVILDELEFLDISRRYALPAMESDPAGWQVVHSIDGTRIFARAPGSP